jgi:hypothetical protein
MLASTLLLSFIGMFDQLLRRPVSINQYVTVHFATPLIQYLLLFQHLVRNQHAMYYSYSKGLLPPMWGRPIA